MSFVDLRGADLTGADATGADVSQAVLVGGMTKSAAAWPRLSDQLACP